MTSLGRWTLTGLLLAGLYEVWRRSGRSINLMSPHLNLQAETEIGKDSGGGNIVGIQPFMFTLDYASAESFYTKLDGYLARAANRGWLKRRTMVVLPEHLGTWLVAVEEKQAVYHARTVEGAMRLLALSHLPRLPAAWLFARAKSRLSAALFGLKASKMAAIYQQTLSKLARKYQITLVGGSIVLPEPKIEAGVLQVGRGALYNTAVVYDSDGLAYPEVVRKIFPIDSERPFVTPAPQLDVPIFKTPLGQLAVLVCADSWYPAVYDVLQAMHAEVVAVPSFLVGDQIWDAPWPGYNGSTPPPDVDQADYGRLTEGEAWLKYAMASRLAQTEAKIGLNIFLRGKLWDLGADGYPIIVRHGMVEAIDRCQGASLTNIWL